MPEFLLEGCTPEPLMAYLKALGILRVVAEQNDRDARGTWRSGAFALRTDLDESALVRFFRDEYRPTPIVAPWAGGSGFFGKDNREAVDAIASGQSARIGDYREVIEQVRSILIEERQTNKPSDEAKARLLRRYRRELPDRFVDWMDCALVLQGEGQAFPPLLGTGGNDGRLDFTQNFMQRVVELGIVNDRPPTLSDSWLKQSLFGEATGGLLTVAVGQFDPGRAGGPNAGQGLEAGSFVNPWDFVLMLEGAVLLAGSIARRMGSASRDKAAFPFTVRASAVGYGSAGEQDGATGRGEIWLPLWSKPATLAELALIFAEGRADVSGRQSRDSVDFARAVAGLGVDRGIASFVRFGFLKRSGKSFVAAPEGYFEVKGQPDVNLFGGRLGDWIDQFRRASRGENTPPRFASAARRIDAAIFDYCRYGGPRLMADVLCALGNAERELANGEKFRKTDQRTIRPVPTLSAAWLSACDDGSSEYALAWSLAFIRSRKGVGDLRANLEAVESQKSGWTWAEKGGSVVWSGADLERNLFAALTRRVMDAGRERNELDGPDPRAINAGRDERNRLPLASRYPVPLVDVAAFLDCKTDDRRLEELLWGLMLVEDADKTFSVRRRPSDAAEVGAAPLPRAYALLKLLFLTSRVRVSKDDRDGVWVTPEPSVLGRLRAEDLPSACEIARRRLRASGLIPMPGSRQGAALRRMDVSLNGVSISRLAAALIFPVYQTRTLARLMLRHEPEKASSPADNAD